MSKSAGYVSPEYLRRTAELGQSVKTRSYEMMNIKEGDLVLDLGCGPGMDIIPLARLVGPRGKVVAVDLDEEMLARTDRLASEYGLSNRIELQQLDITSDMLEAESFNACRAERVFQVIPHEPSLIFNKLTNATKPGGAIVIADTDWATASVDFSNPVVERKLMSYFSQKMRPNGFAGRQQYAAFVEAGFNDIQLENFPIVQADFNQTPFGNWLVEEATKNFIVSEIEGKNWLEEHAERNQKGLFYSCVNMIITAGKKA